MTVSPTHNRPDAVRHLGATALLDYAHPALRDFVESWRRLPERDRIGAIYAFVCDDIPFGYNATDDVAASHVLADGHAQCNT